MKKKIRWEDKVFNWIYRQSTFSESDEIYLNQRILHKKPVNNIIYIYADPRANRNVGLAALLISGAVMFLLAKGAKFSFIGLLISFILGFPFLLFGIGYLRKSKRLLKPWRIDLEKRKFFIAKVAIPFDRIDHLSFTRLQDANEFIASSYDYSYQLNFEMNDKEQLTLFSDRDQMAIINAGEFISEMTGIPLNSKVTNA